MQKQPLVTLGVTTYNASPYLPLTLKSISKLNWQNLELIAVDNLSKDKTASQLKQAGFRVIEKETGLLEARSILVSEASGDYIALFDADEVMMPDLIARSVELCEKGDFDYLIWEEKSFEPKNWLDWLFYADRKLNHTLRNDDAVLGMLAPRFFRAGIIKKTFSNIPVKELKGLLTQDYAILQYELAKLSTKQGYLPESVEQQEVNDFIYFWKHFYRYGKRAAMVERNPVYVERYMRVFQAKTRFRPSSFKYFWLWLGANVLLVLKGVPWFLGYKIEKMKG